MTFDYIKHIIKSCEYLNDFDICVDYISQNEKSVSIIPVNSQNCLRTYSDGEKVIGVEFKLIIRLKTDVEDKSENYRLLDNISNWLYEFEPEEFKSEAPENFIPLKMEVVSGPVLDSDDIHSGRYKIDCRFKYLLKKYFIS